MMNPTSALLGGDIGPLDTPSHHGSVGRSNNSLGRELRSNPASNNNNNNNNSMAGGIMPPGLSGKFRIPPGMFQPSSASSVSPAPSHHQNQHGQREDSVSTTATTTTGGHSMRPPGVSFAPQPYLASTPMNQQQQQHHEQHQHHASVGRFSAQQHMSPGASHHSHHHHHHPPHIPSEVLFASERPGMRPLPDSAYMISGTPHDLHLTQQERNDRIYNVAAAEAVAQQAAQAMSPFAQRLARKMHQQLQVERLPDTPAMLANDMSFDGFDPAAGGQHHFSQQNSIFGALYGHGGNNINNNNNVNREGSHQSNSRGGTPTPRRGRSLSMGRIRTGTVSTTAALERNRSPSATSTRMRIGAFTVEYKEPPGELQKRIQLATKARRAEINRRSVTRLHRPTAAGSFAELNPCEPRIVEPGMQDTAAHRPAELQVTTSVQRSRTPLRSMTRQDWGDQRRQHSFTQELRRHSCDVMRRSVSNHALSYVNKHRGVEHTYLSEGAKWFTKPSPRLGIPCRMTIASNEYGPSPGPGAYNLPSSFLGR